MRLLSLITLFILATLINANLRAQAPEFTYEVEEKTIDPDVLPIIENEVGYGAKTYRIYIRIPENFELQAITSEEEFPMLISSSTQFYQHPLGGATSIDITEPALAFFPPLNFDSWITIGPETTSADLLIVVPDSEILENFESGGNFIINDPIGAAFLMPTVQEISQNTADEDGRILIAQLTTNGQIDLCLNFQTRRLNTDGSIFAPIDVVRYSNECLSIEAPEPIEGLACAFDLNSSGSVTTADLAILLVAFGCDQNCEIDVNGDGDTGSEEILSLLTVFGENCE